MLAARRAALGTPLLIALVLALAASVIVAAAPSARADSSPNCPPGSTPDPTTRTCIISISSSSSAPAPTSTGGGGGGGTPSCVWRSIPMACYRADYGDWDATLECYVKYASPQPPASDPVWQGHQPGDGSIWQTACPGNGLGGVIQYLIATQWFQNPPVGPDPAVLAQQAAAEMTMRAADIQFAPKRGSTALVGLPLWMWDAKSVQTWGPQSVSVSAGGLTVTATSAVTQIVFDMGDGSLVTCTDGGTAYQQTYGGQASPDCGHTYTVSSATQAGAAYTVRATSTWVLTWTATNGQRGTLTFTLSDTAALAVGEAQAVVQGGTQ